MSDLISRSALIEAIIQHGKDIKSDVPMIEDIYQTAHKHIIDLVNIQPTAYDVEKVVAELEEETDCPNFSMYCADAHICGFDEMRKQAIDIVKRGGVE